MIMISKHTDNGNSLFKPNPFNTADAILIRSVLEADFPMFDLATEYTGGVATRKDSEFAISFSFLQSETSVYNSDTILNLLRRGDRNFRYHIVIDLGTFRFSGTFKSEDIKYGFTFVNADSYKASIIVKGVLAEFFEYTSTLTSEFTFSSQQELTFEEYISTYHLDFIDVNTGDLSYNERLGGDDVVFQQIYYGNTGADGYTDWGSKTRWETFFELSKGMGFDFDFVVKYSAEDIFNNAGYNTALNSLYEIKIFFKSDITDYTAITLTRANTHDEITIPKQNKYVWIGTRQQTPSPIPDLTIARGILYGDGIIHESDTSDAPNATPPNPPNAAYSPYFQIDDQYISWLSGTGSTVEYERTGIFTIPLTLYSCSTIEAYGQYIRVGAITYSHFFVSKVNGWHLPIQRYAAAQYKRYINSQAKKGKILKVALSDVPNLQLWSKVIMSDLDGESEYYVSNISALNWFEQTVVISLINL